MVSLKISIVGAEIAGLAAAIGLAWYGHGAQATSERQAMRVSHSSQQSQIRADSTLVCRVNTQCQLVPRAHIIVRGIPLVYDNNVHKFPI